jgi:hypothetical protein
MAAETTVSITVELTGLGMNIAFIDKGTDGTTPDAVTQNYRTIATPDTAEALDLGDVATETILVIRAITYDLDIDLDFSSSFDADLTIKAGEPAALIPNPAGVVYVKNNGAAEAAVYEYLLLGTT